jgi:hypothetical protein
MGAAWYINQRGFLDKEVDSPPSWEVVIDVLSSKQAKWPVTRARMQAEDYGSYDSSDGLALHSEWSAMFALAERLKQQTRLSCDQKHNHDQLLSSSIIDLLSSILCVFPGH